MIDNANQKDDLRGKMAETRDNLVQVGQLAKGAVQDKFQDLKSSASDRLEAGKEKLQDLEESLVRCIRESPMRSLLVAAGIGMVFGCSWRRG